MRQKKKQTNKIKMLQNFSLFQIIYNDAPQPWQIGFQDSACPGFTGIVELHNTIFFYLVVIVVSVFWLLGSIMYYYNDKSNHIIHKYLNHGTLKCLHTNKNLYSCIQTKKGYSNFKNRPKYIRNYSSSVIETDNMIPIKYYSDAYNMKSLIYKENKNKSGIYKFTNKINGKSYIGSSINLTKRFYKYFNISYISTVKNDLTISRALIKYGYSNFSLEILEYCSVEVLLEREQYYFDIYKPDYNIELVAGSSIGIVRSKETKNKISQSLKGKYVGEKNHWFGKTHSDETKNLMSQNRIGNKNPFYGKFHSSNTKLLMKKLKLGQILTTETKKAISMALGSSIYLYEVKFHSPLPLTQSHIESCGLGNKPNKGEAGEDQISSENLNQKMESFLLLKQFTSIREIGKYFNVSHSTISRYIKSGAIFKSKYKISKTLIKSRHGVQSLH